MPRHGYSISSLCCVVLACSSGKGSPSDAAPVADSSEVSTVATRNAAPSLPGSRDPAVLARAAVVVGSCIPDDGVDRDLADMWHVNLNHALSFQRSGLQAECLAASKGGCEAVKDCLGVDLKYGTQAGCQACEGSIATFCETTQQGLVLHETEDCAAVGMVCDALAGCSEAPATACVSDTFQAACAPTGRPEACSNEFAGDAILLQSECGKLGLTCTGGQCVGPGDACQSGAAGSEGELTLLGLGCAGTRLDACVGGHEQMVDCTEQGPGFSCQSFAGSFFCGLASECLPGDEAGSPTGNRCEDMRTVVLCNAGRIDRVDCQSLGFSACSVDQAHGQYGCIPTLAAPPP
jgi:hypothetical protein